MIKSWLDLYRLNISKHTEKLPHKYVPKKIGNKTIFKPHPDTSKYLDYLSWSKCLALLYENGAKSIIIGRGAMDMNVPNLDHFVTVRVEIDSVARALIYPMIK